MTIADNLTLLNSTKQDIKAAIAAKGVDMTGVAFTDYDTKIGEIPTGGGSTITFDEWTRHSDWLTVPTITPTSEEVYILMAVNNVPLNGIRFLVEISAITVDWGDGTVENYPAGSYCEHFYDYNNVALNGTLSSRGYKQALIHITPQTTFAPGTLINLVQQPTGYRTDQNVSILEVHFAIANGDIAFPTTVITSTTSMRMFDCEYINIKAWKPTSLASKFANLTSVVKIDIPFNPSSGNYGTTAHSMFKQCQSLLVPPLFNTSTITAFTSMFEFSGIQTLPEYDYSSATALNNMFNYAKSLVYVPDMDIPNVTLMVNMFYGCESLVRAPNFTNMPAVTSLNGLFAYCSSLVYIPDTYNTSAVTDMTSVFESCKSLKYLPNWNYSSVTAYGRFYGMNSLVAIQESVFSNPMTISGANLFYQCYSLVELPSSFSNVTITTSMDNMFQDCYSLRKIPTFSIVSGQITGTIEFSDVFRNCRSLIEIGAIDLNGNTGITSLSNIFFQDRSLQKIDIIGLRVTFTIADCCLGATALNTLYTNLATVTGQTITVTGNPGTATDNPAIATAKGWTVVG